MSDHIYTGYWFLCFDTLTAVTDEKHREKSITRGVSLFNFKLVMEHYIGNFHYVFDTDDTNSMMVLPEAAKLVWKVLVKVKGAIDPKLYAQINGKFFHDSEDVHPRYTNAYLKKVLEKMKPEFIRGWWTRELDYPRYEPSVADWAAALHEKKHGPSDRAAALHEKKHRPSKRRRGELDKEHPV